MHPSRVLLFEGPVTVLAKSAEKRTERMLYLLDDRLVTVDGGTRSAPSHHHGQAGACVMYSRMDVDPSPLPSPHSQTPGLPSKRFGRCTSPAA